MFGESGDDGKKKKRIAVIGVSSLILVAMVVAVTVSVSHSYGSSTTSGNDSSQISSSMKAIKAICQPTDYRETCVESLSSVAGNTSDPKTLVKAAFKVAMSKINSAADRSTVLQELEKDVRASQVTTS